MGLMNYFKKMYISDKSVNIDTSCIDDPLLTDNTKVMSEKLSNAETSAIDFSFLKNAASEFSLFEKPYPHIESEEVYSPSVLSAIDKYWPDPTFFSTTGIIGDGILQFSEKMSILPKESQEFWIFFVHDIFTPLQQRIFEAFSPYYIAKYGELLNTVHLTPFLMEAQPGFVEHPVHNHHYHNPTWLFTSLVYLDDPCENTRGTALFATNDEDLKTLARISAQTLQWEDMQEMKPTKEVNCGKNRMLAFIDSPISYHGVLPSKAPLSGKRRIIRCHASAAEVLINQLYNMPPNRYAFHRRRASKDPIVIDMLIKEIEQLKNVCFQDKVDQVKLSYTFDPIFYLEKTAVE